MAEILVLAEHVGDDVKKVTLELITLARRFGEPSVVWTGPGAEGGQARCAEYGAARMYVADDAAIRRLRRRARRGAAGPAGAGEVPGAGAGGLRRPRARRSRAYSRSRSTPACSPTRWTCSPATTARSPSSPIFGGAIIVHSRVRRGRRSWRCGRTPWHPSRASGAAEISPVSLAGEATGARVTNRVVAERSERPDLTEASIVVSGDEAPAGPRASASSSSSPTRSARPSARRAR